MIRHDDENQILRFIAYATDRGHVPTYLELEVVAAFRVRGGLYRCLDALSRVAAMELERKQNEKGLGNDPSAVALEGADLAQTDDAGHRRSGRRRAPS